jgi:protein-disulfide isomerase
MDEHPTPSGSGESSPSPYLIPGAILLAGILIAGAVIYGSSPSSFPSGGQGGGKAALEGSGGEKDKPAPANLADDDPTLGDPGAPVSIVEFGDFQCPFCGRFFSTTEKEIIEKYVKTGKARFTYRDFAFLGQESEWAAIAAECADEQGKFWAYHDYLYSHQRGENQGAFSKENLKRFAKEVGLDEKGFNECLDADKYLDEVRKDTEDGRKAGVGGTPSSFVNGYLITGAVPFSVFQQKIDEELEKAGK